MVVGFIYIGHLLLDRSGDSYLCFIYSEAKLISF